MPSPSKIPRLRAAAGRKGDVLEPAVADKGKTQKERVKTKSEKRLLKPEIKAFIQEKPKKSPHRGLRVIKSSQKENQMPKTALHDRRGISEIKKSEGNLRMRVEALEHDIDSMKHDMNATKHEVEKKEKLLEEARQNESTLKQEFEDLKEKNTVQAHALENMNIDPVAGAPIRTTDLFYSLVTSCVEEHQTFASDLRSCMADVSQSLSGIQERIDLLPDFGEMEIVTQ